MAVINKTNKSKSTTVNESLASPKTAQETSNTIQTLVNALKGVYGNGDWDGGLGDIATGYYHRYAMYWDAKLSFTASGSVTLTFPFTVVDSIVKVFDVTSKTMAVYYLDNSNSLSLTSLNGKTIIEVSFVQNTKENQ